MYKISKIRGNIMIYDAILETIGKTPLVELHKLEKEFNLKARLVAKVEFLNPGGSVKKNGRF